MKIVPIAERMKLVVKQAADGSYSGWWEEKPDEVVKGKDDIEVIGQLCCVRCANIGIYIEWQSPNGTVV